MVKNIKNILFAFIALVMMFSAYGVNSAFVCWPDSSISVSYSSNDLLCIQLDAEDFEDEQINFADRILFSINHIISPTFLSTTLILSQPHFTFLQPPINFK